MSHISTIAGAVFAATIGFAIPSPALSFPAGFNISDTIVPELASTNGVQNVGYRNHRHYRHFLGKNRYYRWRRGHKRYKRYNGYYPGYRYYGRSKYYHPGYHYRRHRPGFTIDFGH